MGQEEGGRREEGRQLARGLLKREIRLNDGKQEEMETVGENRMKEKSSDDVDIRPERFADASE